MKFISTRNAAVQVEASYAILHGLSDDGGLYVPEHFPQITTAELSDLLHKSYQERAAFILAKYLTEFSYDQLLASVQKAYATFEDPCDPAPVVKLDESVYLLELFHGPTVAFKDMALCLLPHLMQLCLQKQKVTEQLQILVATSGDTGKAALQGFQDIPNMGVMVFYPEQGVSAIQRLQMITQQGSNVFVAGVNGNFDDCQSAVKRIFSDQSMRERLKKNKILLSSANSINFGRLLPQIVYYVSSYLDMVASGDIEENQTIQYCVPTGNFGNILAAYYAKRMGIPIGKLICASNSNRVLTDFFKTGTYNSNRKFYTTMSPSMDILISSNLERLLFELTGRDSDKTCAYINDLMTTNTYQLTKQELEQSRQLIVAGFADEDSCAKTIKSFFEQYDYVLDPHTSVAMSVYHQYLLQSNDDTKTIVVSTASPYKFAQDVLRSLTANKNDTEAFLAIKKIYQLSAVEIPQAVSCLAQLKPRFLQMCNPDCLSDVVMQQIGGRQ